MLRRLSMAGAALVLIAVLAVPASAGGPSPQLSARLKGAAEVPGPGDPNGRGEAFVTIKTKKRKVCFQLSWRRIADPTAAHIHKGERGDAGRVKVLLFEDDEGLPSPGSVDGCVKNQKRKLLRRIKRNPNRFYVNVHNDPFPDGAIRGQLRRAL
jgi:hypothetical protein